MIPKVSAAIVQCVSIPVGEQGGENAGQGADDGAKREKMQKIPEKAKADPFLGKCKKM